RGIPITPRGPDEAYARLPSDLALPERTSEIEVPVSIEGGRGEARLVLINDARFPDPFALALSPDGKKIAAISPTTDEMVIWDLEAKKRDQVATGDGPSALATFRGPAGENLVALVHSFSPELRVYDLDRAVAPVRTIFAPVYATAIAIDASGVA